ncbi:SDR family oxidoreductase [Psychromonas algicola]|uniref:SDR family oxidoreductase n=1 Tax=Psychromonas algicola TaxID=2555642 RepID=UPI00106879A7|nr:SDR family oxidoreductase [Psychromonas sp. RZ5]TEW52847.1 SDR family oxidoreductase [Psychromonas sp. RZ5]
METVLITGASRGIGLELTKQFLDLNYKVISTYRVKPSLALDTLTSNKNLTLIELEVTNEDSISNLSRTLSGITIDILINNAGVIGPEQQSMAEIKQQDWLNTFATNSIAPLMVSHAVLPSIQAASKPRILTISSLMGSINSDSVGMYAYRSSKAAVNKVMKILSVELKDQGIAVCLIHPGWVQTDMGGQQADISVEESATGILEIACNLTMSQSGHFLTWQGNKLDW